MTNQSQPRDRCVTQDLNERKYTLLVKQWLDFASYIEGAVDISSYFTPYEKGMAETYRKCANMLYEIQRQGSMVDAQKVSDFTAKIEAIKRKSRTPPNIDTLVEIIEKSKSMLRNEFMEAWNNAKNDDISLIRKWAANNANKEQEA